MDIHIDRGQVDGEPKTKISIHNVRDLRGPHNVYLNDSALEWLAEYVEKKVGATSS